MTMFEDNEIELEQAKAAKAAAEGVREEPVFYDTLFRVKKKHTYKVVPAPAPALEGPIVDTHAHLAILSHRDVAMARAAALGVDFICDMTDIVEDAGRTYAQLDGWKLSAHSWLSTLVPENTPSLPTVRLSCGCHPHNAKDYNDFIEQALSAKLADPRTCILGEIGLDYHYDLSPRDVQRKVFRRQIRLAKRAGLPVALHVREAHDDAMGILDEEGFPEAGCILHCFNLGPEEVKRWVDHDCYIAFGGPLTFKKADEVREAATLVPLDRLLTETDCPYMTPEPLRGRENGPEYVIFTAAKLAEVRGCMAGAPRREFLQTLHDNATTLLDRGPTPWQLSAR
jgi:TatD DNase family protein